MFIHGKNTLLAGLVVLCGTAMSARADIVFNFNSLSPGATNAQIAAYMDGLLSCANCVTVTGASVDTTYSGDGHTVGNNGKSLTLGTSDGATNNSTLTPSSTYDSFLSNVTNGASTVSSEIVITFSQAVNVTGFDYEIFPDATCSSPSHCNSYPDYGTPDFTFATNGNVGSPIFTTNAVFPSASGTDGSSIHSPNSCPVWWNCGTEQSAQYIGTWSGNLTGVTQLDFIDWPAAIGVDNIKLSTSTVPEPRFGAMLLGGLLLAGLAGRKRLGFARS